MTYTPSTSSQASSATSSGISAENYIILANKLKSISGFHLEEGKNYLVETRLNPIKEEHGFSSLNDLVSHFQRALPGDTIVKKIQEAMATHETFFFRDNKPFTQLRNIIIPNIIKNKTNKVLNIWCAACSSGQEPYSISMLLSDFASQMEGWQVSILATDFSNHIVDKAKKGIFTQFEVQRGLPIQYVAKCFTKVEGYWQINEDIRRRIQFKQQNLMDKAAYSGKYDVIFCRNVLIYFDPQTKTQVFTSIANCMAPDARLFLGGAETIIGLTDRLKPVPEQRGCYQLA